MSVKIHKSSMDFLKNSASILYNIDLTDEETVSYFDQLPEHMKNECELWGTNDITIRDTFIDIVLKDKKL